MFNVEFYDADGSLAHNANVATLRELNEMARGRTSKIISAGVISHEEAMEVIKAYQDIEALPGTLEALGSMKRDLANSNLTHREQHAFEFIYDGLRSLFHGDEV